MSTSQWLHFAASTAPRISRNLPAAVSLLLVASSAAAQNVTQPAPKPAPPLNTQQHPQSAVLHPTALQLETWRKTLLHTAKPKTGCFTADYPSPAWREVPCKTPPNKLYPPKRPGTRTETVGGKGPDFSGVVTGHLTEAEGSFDKVVGATSECTVQCPSGICPATPSCTSSTGNVYSLQLNTKPFTTSACSASPNKASCQGWEQFVYNSGGSGVIQYWLENYGPSGTSCPAPRGASCVQGSVFSDGWCPFSFTPGSTVYCVVNAKNSAPAPAEAITALSGMQLTGAASGNAGATTDEITFTVAGKPYTASGNNYFPDLNTQWQEVEFNVFGDSNSDQAVFNSGTTLDVRTSLASGTSSAPSCDGAGFTGESNNLTLVNTPSAAVQGGLPALLFSESFPAPAGGAASCADATSVGDTHLTTFSGLYYDFQAFGDFLLAQDGPDFRVQTRQASGAPQWPNASINKAVAMQLGATRVALYIEPARLVINGAPNNLADRQTVTLPTGVQVTRLNNLYVVSDNAGNRVRVTLNPTWINVNVGLGHNPIQMRGLLGSARSNGQALQTASGAMLKEPVSFNDLYHTYADSWRVSQNDSLFNEQARFQAGVPTKTFFARDLDPATHAQALATCKATGISAPDLLESCTLDTAVFHDQAATKVFLHAPVPLRVLRPEPRLSPELK